jgi:hypothetical protein
VVALRRAEGLQQRELLYNRPLPSLVGNLSCLSMILLNINDAVFAQEEPLFQPPATDFSHSKCTNEGRTKKSEEVSRV